MNTKISLIVAMDNNRTIGKDNKMPWHLPNDLKHFKAITMGKPIVMGRKTFESIGRPLPGRTNIILTSDIAYLAPGCIVINKIDNIFKIANREDIQELMIIGGAQLYNLLLPYIQKIYMTLIDGDFKGDTFFPVLDSDAWEEVSREYRVSDELNPYNHSFVTLIKK